MLFEEQQILLSESCRELDVFPFQKLENVKLNDKQAEGDPSGFVNIRSQDFFCQLHFCERGRTFHTSQFCKFGLYVGEYSGECLEFHPNQLSLENRDCNNDGFADIRFKGGVRNTCQSIKANNALLN